MTDNELLETLESYIKEANASNSTLEKKATLKKYPQLKEIFGIIYGPTKFNVTSANILKNESLSAPFGGPLLHLLRKLSTRELSGHEAIAAVNGYIFESGHKDLILAILDKDLGTRTGATLINSVYPGCVEVFEVALANSYKDVEKKVDIFDGSWYVSRKMDGVRTIAIVDAKGEVEFFSREGKPFDTFGVLAAAIEKLGLKNVVFDGECCIVDKNGREDFKAVTKEMRKKDHVIANPKYLMFDMLTTEEFFSGSSTRRLSERLDKLRSTVEYGLHLEVLHQEVVTEESFNRLQEKVKADGWEGLILRKNVGYKGKRSNDLLKVKSFHDAEYKVLSIETGPFRMISEGKELTVETMTAASISHKGCKVSVGSGWSLEERMLYFKHPEKLIGKKITVKYFEETTNASGGVSLRFPIFIGVRDYE